MHHFFVDENHINNDNAVITGSDVNHIKNVLRMRVGEELLLSDGSGIDYRCKISDFTDNEVNLTILEECSERTELDTKFYLFQGMPKSEKMELIIQKTVELGVYEIIPVDTKRAIVKLDAKKADNKIKRWNAISESAAKQSKRSIIPEVREVMSFKEAIKYAKELDMAIIPYENCKDMATTRKIFESVVGKKSVGIFIGPEGGFDESEIALALENDVTPISLGRRILRTETAGTATMAILMYLAEE